jgi:glycosyltransferase involved in cell wall biosynthesis
MSRILFFVPHPEQDAGYRYRIQQFIPYLKSAGHSCTIAPFSTEKLYTSLRSRGAFSRKFAHAAYCSARRIAQVARLSEFDLVVIEREVFPFFAPLMEKLVLSRHPRVIFSFDDAIYAGHGDLAPLNHPLLYRIKYGRGVDYVVRKSSHVIAGNRILADYARRLNPNVSVVPTVVDCARYVAKPQTKNPPITIGWVGSRSTAPYLRLIEPALKELARARSGNVRFRFYGFPEYRPALPDCESLPFRLDSEIEDLHSLDIGLMPLADTEWCRGKCAFKAIQYMASAVATVASPLGITPDLIQHNFNGLLATSVEEWSECLKVLTDHADVRHRITQAARRTIEASYSLQKWGPKLVALFQSLLSAEQPPQLREAVACDF